MDLRWIILPVFLIYVEANNQTRVQVDLGQSVILTCSEDLQNIYWYIQIYGELRGAIGRTYSRSDDHSTYYSPSFENKFSLKKNTLEIKNITAGDFRIYFCARKLNSNITIVDSFHLVTNASANVSTNVSNTNTSLGGCRTWWDDRSITYSSLCLNVFLVLVITGHICVTCFLKRENKTLQENVPPLYENSQTMETPQYEEIHLSSSRPPPQDDSQRIYYKAQRPHATMPGP